MRRPSATARIVQHAVLIAACALAVLPILWGLSTSLKEDIKVFSYPPAWIPDPITFEHYRTVLFDSNLPHYFFNSAVVALATIVVTVTVAAHAAYAAARLKYRGKGPLLFIVLATSMIPGISILTPLYLISVKVGLHDTYVALILVYSAWQIPTAIWLIRGFIEGTVSYTHLTLPTIYSV